MVEFDDGDRGKISLHNIRLLPPGYQIHCGFRSLSLKAFSFGMLSTGKSVLTIPGCGLGGESTPASLTSTADKRSSTLEQAPVSNRPVPDAQNSSQPVQKRRPGEAPAAFFCGGVILYSLTHLQSLKEARRLC